MGRELLQSDRIRVLVNGIHAKSGGGLTYLRNILPLVSEDPELDVHLFIHRNQSKLFTGLEGQVQLHFMNFSSGFFRTLLWEQIVLPVLARNMATDVTVSPANFGPLFAPGQIIMLGNSLAVAGRETRLVKRLYWAGLTVMTALSLLTCRRAIAVSEFAQKTLTFGLGDRFQRKVTVIHHGVSAVFKSDDSVPRKDYLLAVSDIYIQKNLHTLIQSLVEIRKKFPDIVLKIAGRPVDEGYLQHLNETLDRVGLRHAVEFLGGQTADELLRLYQECQLFVFPSTVETFGIPLVEAMACAAPIVSSNTAAMPEVLGDAGRYFDPLDAEDMAAQIIALLEDEPARQELSKRALQRAQSFSRKSTADQTAALIKSVAAER